MTIMSKQDAGDAIMQLKLRPNRNPSKKHFDCMTLQEAFGSCAVKAVIWLTAKAKKTKQPACSSKLGAIIFVLASRQTLDDVAHFLEGIADVQEGFQGCFQAFAGDDAEGVTMRYMQGGIARITWHCNAAEIQSSETEGPSVIKAQKPTVHPRFRTQSAPPNLRGQSKKDKIVRDWKQFDLASLYYSFSPDAFVAQVRPIVNLRRVPSAHSAFSTCASTSSTCPSNDVRLDFASDSVSASSSSPRAAHMQLSWADETDPDMDGEQWRQGNDA